MEISGFGGVGDPRKEMGGAVAHGSAALQAIPASVIGRPDYAQALSTVGSSSLAAAYKALRALEVKQAPGAAEAASESARNALTGEARTGEVGLALAAQLPVIGSAIGISGAFAAYREQAE
jgi:hypothetical protein